jgi:opacity protein-like surface antigen
MRVLPTSIVALVLLSVQPLNVLAVEPGEHAEDPEIQSRPLYFSVFLGDLQADDNAGQLEQEGDGYGWGLNGGYFVNGHFSLEGEFLWFRREYERASDTVLPDTADNDQRYLTLGLSALAKASHRFGRWRPFVGVGVGYFDTEPYVTDPDGGGFTTSGAPSSNSSIGYQVVVGVAARVRKRFYLEVGWKNILLDSDFGMHSNGEVDLGGSMIYVAARGGGF